MPRPGGFWKAPTTGQDTAEYCRGGVSVTAAALCWLAGCGGASSLAHRTIRPWAMAPMHKGPAHACSLFACLLYSTSCRNGETLYGRSVYRDSSGARIQELSCAPKCSLDQAVSCTLTMPVQVGTQLSTNSQQSACGPDSRVQLA